MHCVITIPGKVETNHRARVARGRAYHDAAYRAYKDAVRLHALSQRPRGWETTGTFAVVVTLHEPDRRRRDLDNLKAIMDGMRGVMFNDDKWVDDLRYVRGAVDRERPRVEVAIRRLGE